MKNTILVCMTTLFLIAYAFSRGVLDNAIDWICGNGHDHVTVDNIEWYYTVEDGNATLGHADRYRTISGNTSGAITIPATLEGHPVTVIGKGAFDGCSNLTSITIPTSVTTIDVCAFAGCSRLTSITIPASVTTIGDAALISCSSLTSITLSTSVTVIGKGAFWDCSSLTSITIPMSVTSIGGSAFLNCSSLMRIDVAEGNTAYSSVDGVLFDKALRQIVTYPSGRKDETFSIPDGVTTINNRAFQGCSSLTSLTIPASVTTIGDVAFGDCSSLTSVTIPESVTTIGDGAFYDCSSLTHVAIPASVTSIENGTFSGCSDLTSIDVSEYNKTYASVDGVLFDKARSQVMRCPEGKVGTFTIPASVTSIGNGTFSDCSSLTNITIPASVTSLGNGTFRGCSDLASIDVVEDNVTYASVDGVLFDKALSQVMRCPEGKAGTFTIPASVTSIEYSAFKECLSLTSITIPASVISLGGLAFWTCPKLTSLIFEGDAPTQVGEYMFIGASPDLVVYYYEGATGWKKPWWNLFTNRNSWCGIATKPLPTRAESSKSE